MVAQYLIQTASGGDAQRLKRGMRPFKSALAWGMGLLDHIGHHCKWPPTVKSEVDSRVSEITKVPLEFVTKRRMQMSPTSWAAECSAHVAWAKLLIEMMHPAVTTEDWSLIDCQEYFVNLEMSLDHGERTTRMLLQRLNREEGTGKRSAQPPSPPEQNNLSEGAWPWFSGRVEDLPWFRQAWETHVYRFYHGLAPEVLVGGLRKYGMPRPASQMVEPAHNPEEAWRLLESHFSRQTRIIDKLMSELLGTERVVNEAQILAHYSRILMAIREAKEPGRLQDLLTVSRIRALIEVLPKKEGNYWRPEQVGVVAKDFQVAFYSFTRARALRLKRGRNESGAGRCGRG
jgi:hypothetical protein